MPRFSLIDEKLVIKLIEEVKKREDLYVPNYHEADRAIDRLSVYRGWEEVASEVGQPERLVKQKWKSLRDTFWKEVKRFGPPGCYAGQWRFYQPLSFVYKCRKKPEEKHEKDSASEAEEAEYLEDDAETVYKFIKKLKGVDKDPLGTESEKQNDDYDALFLNSLKPYFQQLEPLRKLVVRSKIQDLLYSELSAQNASDKKS